jgi:hypothetical protein
MEKAPTIADWRRGDHLDNRRMPLSEVPELFTLAGGHDPLTSRPWCQVAFDQQKVDVVVAHRIVQQMAAWPHPELKRSGIGQPRERIHRDDAAEPATPGIQRIVVAEYPLSHKRARTVGAHHEVRLTRAVVVKAQDGTGAGIVDVHEALAKPNGIRPHGC